MLDLGGGPGKWTIWLARRGHRVVLADLSPRLLSIAERELAAAGVEVEAVIELDARDLGRFAAEEFDAVLALGPFYHLVERTDREKAARETLRVLRPGGVLLATVMTRYSWLLGVLLERGSAALPAVRRLLEEGVYRTDEPERFTEAYLFRAAEVAPFFARIGFEPVRVMASQGILNQVQEEVAGLHERDPDAYQALLEIAYQAATDPAVLGLSGHILFAGRKPAS